MRVLALLSLALPLAARGDGFGIAGGLGFAYGAGAARDATAPALSLRASYGRRSLSAGLSTLLVVGSEASYRAGGQRTDSSGLQAWAAVGDVSAQTEGTVSVGLRLGAGLGKVISLNCNCEEVAPLHGHVAPAFFGSAFTSVRVADHYRIALDLSAVRFADLENAGAPFSPPATGIEAWIFSLMLGLQWLQ